MINIFFDIAIIIIVASLLGYLAKALRQPLILAYILTGVIIGPICFGWVRDHDTIMLLSELGIAFLLFIVGLEFDFKKLKDVGLVSGVAGITQVIISFVLGYFLAIWFGFSQLPSVYIGLALAFSSTMIVVKLLTDKNELATLHGRIILVTLLIQDIVAIFALSFLSSVGNISTQFVTYALLKAGLLFLVAYTSSKVILPAVFARAANSTQLLFLFSLAWLFLFSMIAYLADFSIAIGAFLAGISLAGTPYSLEIIGRIRPLTSFFATIFFATLGMQFVFGDITKFIIPISVFTLLVLIVNPLTVMLPVSAFGYKKRTSFLSGIAIGQTSEFSLIIVSLGFALGHISREIVSIVVFVTAITILVTSYTINYSDWLYKKLSKPLSIFDKLSQNHKKFEYLPKDVKHEIVLCGYNRIGYSILKTLKKMRKKLLVIDFNPGVITDLMKKRISCIYGDVGDLEIFERIDLENVKLLISTVPSLQDNLLLIDKVKDANPKTVIFVTASQIDEALQLYSEGADYVILPHFLGGEYVSLLMKDLKSRRKLMKTKLEHIHELTKRQKIGHEHPRT